MFEFWMTLIISGDSIQEKNPAAAPCFAWAVLQQLSIIGVLSLKPE